MNCRDFELYWDDRLDACRADGVDPAVVPGPDLRRAAEEHEASCPSCRSLGVRYQALSQAISQWGPSPRPPADFKDRVLNQQTEDAERTRSLGRSALGASPVRYWGAVAAMFIVAVGLALRNHRPAVGRKPMPRTAGVVDHSKSRALSAAFADARTATLGLARDASAPAARLGRDVLASATLPTASFPRGVSVEAPTGVWQSLGDRVGAGVRPLSGSARHAFGFLIDPALRRGAEPRGDHTGA